MTMTREPPLRAIQYLDSEDHLANGTAGSFIVSPEVERGDEGTFRFICPCGCGAYCAIRVRAGRKPEASPSWTYNGKPLAPTLHPSVNRLDCGWHGWLRDGYWESV